jgi:signal transduction histidine kinase
MQSETTLALSKTRSPEEYRKSLEVISEEITHMSSVISKLLFLARVDNGKDNLNLSRVSLNELLSELASDVEVLSEDKSLNFELKLDDHLEVIGDKVKLRELFLNLLDNAIRCTPPHGRIIVSLSRSGDKALIAVADTGVGISEEHLPHIFERFYRVNKSHPADNSGSGLGLAISKHIAEMHQGVIEVSSRAGLGATFTVVLPLAQPE